MIFPWQQEQWQVLCRAQQIKQLPHALLLTGIPGSGKSHFACCLARLLLCTTSFPHEIDDCHTCHLIMNQCHANLLVVSPLETAQAIKIDQIRQAIDFIQQASFDGKYQLLIIHPAEQMNINAMNALLKTLEEPPSNSMIVLISHNGQLPATILSRCQRLFFPQPPEELALAWLTAKLPKEVTSDNASLLLRLSNGAPLAAIKLLDEDYLAMRTKVYQGIVSLLRAEVHPLTLAKDLERLAFLPLIDLLFSFLIDLISLQMQKPTVHNQDYQQQLMAISQQMILAKHLDLLRHLENLRKHFCEGLNLNKLLAIENTLLKWQRCIA